jgi:hypothetical protein
MVVSGTLVLASVATSFFVRWSVSEVSKLRTCRTNVCFLVLQLAAMVFFPMHSAVGKGVGFCNGYSWSCPAMVLARRAIFSSVCHHRFPEWAYAGSARSPALVSSRAVL